MIDVSESTEHYDSKGKVLTDIGREFAEKKLKDVVCAICKSEMQLDNHLFVFKICGIPGKYAKASLRVMCQCCGLVQFFDARTIGLKISEKLP